MVAHEGDLAVALVGRAVDPVLPGLAPKAADLVGGGWREAAAQVFVEEQVHAVALDKERVVVIALLALHVALASLVVEGPVGWAAARRAAQVVDAALVLRVAEEVLVPHLPRRAAVGTAAARTVLFVVFLIIFVLYAQSETLRMAWAEWAMRALP